MVSYEGIFFEKEMIDLIQSVETNKLDKINDEIHCTFKYHPSDNEIFNDIVGKYFEIYLIGYGNDGHNSGFEISIPNELQKYYINYDEQNLNNLKTPHITTSLSNEASAANTKNLNFIPLDKPIKIIGKFGYWIKADNKENLSFEPFVPTK